jgi:hypothetical protein
MEGRLKGRLDTVLTRRGGRKRRLLELGAAKRRRGTLQPGELHPARSNACEAIGRRLVERVQLVALLQVMYQKGNNLLVKEEESCNQLDE